LELGWQRQTTNDESLLGCYNWNLDFWFLEFLDRPNVKIKESRTYFLDLWFLFLWNLKM
jgi:hypothetical protein